MISKRIIACLDVVGENVVKGVRFRDHEVLGNAMELAQRYCEQGVDELVVYDIAASGEGRSISPDFVKRMAKYLDIPFCVAGGIQSGDDARVLLNAGADKVSINTPALKNPQLIGELASEFGSQCVVVGVDSRYEDGEYYVYLYTGSEQKMHRDRRLTREWLLEAQERGAGEVVLNCMSSDGVGAGFDIPHISMARELLTVPLIASGGARTSRHFVDVFKKTDVSGALAAGAFHRQELFIPVLKNELRASGIEVRL
jgi:imidazole glycerol-phosphate synthase subunit HisF